MVEEGVRAPKIYLFIPRYERLFYIVLFSFILLSIAALAKWYEVPTFKTEWFKLLIFFFFFNALHVFLTYAGILVVPGLRNWLREQFQPKRFVVFGPIFAIIIFSGMIGTVSFGRDDIADGLLTSVLLLLVTVHNLGQTKGIAILHNRHLRPFLSEAEAIRQSKAEKTERWLFSGLLSLLIVRNFTAAFFKEYLPPHSIFGLHVIFSLMALALVLNAFRYPQLFRTNKFWYLQGVWLFVATMFDQKLIAFQMAVHGIEYVFLGETVFRRSAKSLSRPAIISGAAMLVALSLAFAFNPRLFPYARSLPGIWTSILVAFCLITEYAHYYLDSIMFRFADPVVRANVAPLFAPPSSPARGSANG